MNLSVDANQGQKRVSGSLELSYRLLYPCPSVPPLPTHPAETRTELCQKAPLSDEPSLHHLHSNLYSVVQTLFSFSRDEKQSISPRSLSGVNYFGLVNRRIQRTAAIQTSIDRFSTPPIGRRFRFHSNRDAHHGRGPDGQDLTRLVTEVLA